MSFFSKRSSQGFDPKSFFKAISSGNADRVSEFLARYPYAVQVKNSDNLFPLNIAAKHGHLQIVKILVDKGAEVYSNPMSSYPAVMDAAWNKQQEVVDYFLHEVREQAVGTNGLGVTINLAARQGWLDIVKEHLARDPLAVHQRGWIGDTPLHWPCHNNYAEIVTLLLDHGADIEADEINWIGGKPLHWASEHAPACTELLLSRGAQVNSRNEKKDSPAYGRTPLIHNACQGNDCAEVTELLLSVGADINAKDAQGKTAFERAKEKIMRGSWRY